MFRLLAGVFDIVSLNGGELLDPEKGAMYRAATVADTLTCSCDLLPIRLRDARGGSC
jgi:hypothetical protein